MIFFFFTNCAEQFDFHMKKNETRINFRPNLKSQSYKNSKENPMIKSLCNCRRHKNRNHKGKKREI